MHVISNNLCGFSNTVYFCLIKNWNKLYVDNTGDFVIWHYTWKHNDEKTKYLYGLLKTSITYTELIPVILSHKYTVVR